jgi:two-component system, LytTR family, response regulator
MTRLVIVDDEKKARESVKALLGLLALDIQIVGEADSVVSAREVITTAAPDVILLDVQLADGTGFDLLQTLKEPYPFIIFITAFEQYAHLAFRFSAIDYLLKPVDPESLATALTKARERIGLTEMETKIKNLVSNLGNPPRDQKRIVLKTAEQIHIVKIKDIIRLESDKNYTTFYLESNVSILVSRTLKEFDEMLNDFGFIRVHQSHLVNIDFIDKFDKREGGYLILRNKASVPVSSRKKEELIKLLETF